MNDSLLIGILLVLCSVGIVAFLLISHNAKAARRKRRYDSGLQNERRSRAQDLSTESKQIDMGEIQYIERDTQPIYPSVNENVDDFSGIFITNTGNVTDYASPSTRVTGEKQLCPVCRNEVHKNQPNVYVCGECSIVYHDDCWKIVNRVCKYCM